MSEKDLSGWASAVLDMPNLVFLVLDTTNDAWKDSDIISAVMLDSTGTILYDKIFFSPRQHTSNHQYTGISQSEMVNAMPLISEWSGLVDVLKGKFVMAYGFDLVQERLSENAESFGLEPVYLVGDCLQQTASEYFRQTYSIKLADACRRVGHHMPSSPPLAIERAQAQLALLEAMSRGEGLARPALRFVEEEDAPDTEERF